MEEGFLDLVLQRILQCLAVGCFFATVFFIGWAKPWVQKTNQKLSKWYSTEKLAKKLDLAIYIDEQFLKIRKILSLISLILAFILVYLSFRF